jgi:hypothetical protein
MKLQTRKRIFYVFILLFVAIGTAVVLYAEGWRLNPSDLQAQKAGGLYVRSYPEDAAITLDGKPIQNQSAFLTRGTFLSSLFPKTYTLQLKENGYDSWTENAVIAPSLVTEMKYAVLVPQNATTVASGIGDGIKNFFEASGGIVAENADGSITWRGKTIANGTIVSHSTDLKTVVTRSGTGSANGTYWLYDFTNATSTNLTALLKTDGVSPSAITSVNVDPYNDTSLIVQTPNAIIGVDSETHHFTAIDTATAGSYIGTPIAISPSTLAWVRIANATGASRVMIYDKFSGDLIDSSLVVPGTVRQLGWIRGGTLGIIEANNVLYLYNIQAEQLTSLADDVKQFYPTSDGAAVAALEYHSLEIFSFTSANYYRFNLPQIQSIENLSWYKDETHLFVSYPDHVSFLDVADTSLKNFIAVSQGPADQYDVQQNSLYALDPAHHVNRFDFPQ